MDRFVRLTTALVLATAVPVGVSAAEKVPELPQVELAKVQARTYSAPAAAVMASAVAAMQSQGYLGIEANRDAGTVAGSTDAKSKLMFNIFWGLGKKKLTQTAQFLVEEIKPGETSLRLNLFINESKTRSIVFGSRMTDALLVKHGAPYNDLLAVVDQEVARRVAAKSVPAKISAPEVASGPAGVPSQHTPEANAPATAVEAQFGTARVKCDTCR